MDLVMGKAEEMDKVEKVEEPGEAMDLVVGKAEEVDKVEERGEVEEKVMGRAVVTAEMG